MMGSASRMQRPAVKSALSHCSDPRTVPYDNSPQMKAANGGMEMDLNLRSSRRFRVHPCPKGFWHGCVLAFDAVSDGVEGR